MNKIINTQGISHLVDISHYAAGDVAYIQGGGGNTSVKLDDTKMAVKASGCKLSDMAQMDGYVVVDYKKIKDYFDNADNKAEEFEPTSSEVLKSSVIKTEGLKVLRPSVEAGFHSLLRTYVIHTHSVYTNILCCSKEGKGITEELFEDISYIWLPYVNPGALLTSVIAKAIQDYGKIPDVIFMENHGVIVNSDSSDAAIQLHQLINNRIKGKLELGQEFPFVGVTKRDDGLVASTSSYVKDYFSKHEKNLEVVREKVLYPDQLVYLNNSIYKKDKSESDIFFKDGELVYSSSEKQAQVNEETLVAYLYVINSIKKKGLTLVSMTSTQQAFILGWESEAYRKSMLK